MIAQLESVVSKPFHLPESPLRFLPLNAAIPKKIVSRVGAGKKTEYRLVVPVGMRLPEIEPDPNAARRIYLELAIVLDVPELFWRSIVEHEYDGRNSSRQVELLVQHIRHVHGSVTAIVQQLEILPELPALARVIAIVIC